MGNGTNNLFWVLVYISCGMSLGTVMAISHNALQELPLAHILDVGFVLALIYCVIHRLWRFNAPFHPSLTVVRVLQHIHQAGALTMFTGLLLLYGEIFLDAQSEPTVAIALLSALISALTILYVTSETTIER